MECIRYANCVNNTFDNTTFDEFDERKWSLRPNAIGDRLSLAYLILHPQPWYVPYQQPALCVKYKPPLTLHVVADR